MSDATRTIAIRAACAEHAGALAELSAQLGYPADAAAIAARLARIREDLCAGVVFIALDTAGHVIGWTHVAARLSLEEDPFTELAGLVVDAAARGRGVGAALLRAAEDWSRQNGFLRLRVRSNVLRERAHGFYRREGYLEKKRQLVFDKLLT